MYELLLDEEKSMTEFFYTPVFYPIDWGYASCWIGEN